MAKQNIKDPGAHHNSSGALIRRFLPYLAKHKAVLFLDLFCAALTTLCDIFLLSVRSQSINRSGILSGCSSGCQWKRPWP